MTDVLTMMLVLSMPGVRHMAVVGLRQSAPRSVFPGEHVIICMLRFEKKNKSYRLSFVVSQQDVSKVQRKKRKQVDDSIDGI